MNEYLALVARRGVEGRRKKGIYDFSPDEQGLRINNREHASCHLVNTRSIILVFSFNFFC